MPLPIELEDFDFKSPDYLKVFQHRFRKLQYIRENPHVIPNLKLFYKDNIAQFIIDWGCTFDPRNIERGLPAVIPFLLFKRQEEWVDFIIDNWKNRERGITLKSRDMGMSWLSVAFSCAMCLFHNDLVIGFGSRKEEYVDKIGDPKSLFDKARTFMDLIPREFKGTWDRNKHAPNLRIIFPDNGSIITGESGDGIGRGARTSLYFVDESAFLERPHLAESALSATTNCRQDISTPNGTANVFAEKWFEGKIKKFEYHWRDDPRKDDAWYEKMCREFDKVTIAQEVDLDFHASVEGILIPAKWVDAAIDADVKLGVEVTGKRGGSLDVADGGKDMNAFSVKKGIYLENVMEWSGKNSDIYDSVEQAFSISDQYELESFYYDNEGLGAGVKGDARKINENRERKVKAIPFRASDKVYKPDDEMVKGRKNKDYFANLKAQAWWALKIRFQNTFRAVVEGLPFDPDEIISINGNIKLLNKLKSELSQVTSVVNGAGKIVIDKQPDGTKSPNLADSVMMTFFNNKRHIDWDEFL